MQFKLFKTVEILTSISFILRVDVKIIFTYKIRIDICFEAEIDHVLHIIFTPFFLYVSIRL